MMGSSERIRVPLGIFSIATRPFPFPGTSCKECMGLPVMFCIFMPSLPLVWFGFDIDVLAQQRVVLPSGRNGRNKCDFEASLTLSRFVGLFAQWSVAAGAWCLFVRNLVAELPTIRSCIYSKALLQEYHRYPEIIRIYPGILIQR